MQRTYRVSVSRAGLMALVAIALLLAHPGTSIAGGKPESTRGAATLGSAALQRGGGYNAAQEVGPVRSLQRALRSLGWRTGPVDGLFGPRTQSAVMRFQDAAGLEADGIVGPQTRRVIRGALARVLQRGAGYAQADGSPRVRRLQKELRLRGLRPGPVDGRFGPRTEAALARLQRAVRLPAHGVVDAATRRVLARAGSAAGNNGAGPARVERQALGLRPGTAQQEAGPAATVTVPQLGGAVMAALLIGALVAWLVATRGVVPTSIPLAHGVMADAPRQVALQPSRAPSVSAAEPVVERVRALGYVSVPNADRRGARLRKQAGRIDALCEQRGWRLVETVRDVEGNNGKGLDRPGLQYALERIAKGEASCIVVSHLGRLTRSAGDLGRILERLQRHDGRLVAMDVALDTGSRGGDAAAKALVSIGVWERQRLGERTRKGLAAARARGMGAGRPAVSDVPGLEEKILAMRAEGMTLQAIADQLNDEGVPTLRGGTQWRPSSVQASAGYRRPGRSRGEAGSDGRLEDEP